MVEHSEWKASSMLEKFSQKNHLFNCEKRRFLEKERSKVGKGFQEFNSLD
ncbi:hypothetical protein BVRB_9g213240 [Beta vulgaris subsp. vulgaris]|nr:hypothetical protein BVRB_9g213240 [Beta vulgaris subsp. vulgaris]